MDLGLEHSKPYKKSARIVGECFVKDTLVLSKKGLVPIQDIGRGDLVYTQKGLGRVTELYEMPPKQLLKVTLDNGVSNVVTPLQKLKILNKDFRFEWRDADKIKPGDHVVLKSHYPSVKKNVKLKKVNRLNPERLNEDIAYLLGIFTSEGWIEKNKDRKDTYRIGIACNSRGIIDKVADILMKEFDYLPNIEKIPYVYINAKGETIERCRYQIRISRGYITKFLIENFNIAEAKAPTKKIPDQIFISPKTVIYAFISGLIDGDGSVHKNRATVHYGSVSEELIDKLQVLLQQLGVFSARRVDNTTGEHFVNGKKVVKRLRFHYLEFSGVNAKELASKTALYDKEKDVKRANLLGRNLKKSMFETIPYFARNIFSELSKSHIGGGWYIGTSGEKFRAGVKYSTGAKIRYSKDLQEKPLRKSQIVEWGIKEKLEKINSPLYAFVKDIIENDVYFMRVASVTKAGTQVTYDIQVEGEHEFIANGMVSHNCLGKYHPHGDTAVYDSLVRMVQKFSLRYPLVDGQGNFGSVDGDSAAAMRYTEARMASIADELLEDIDRNTVDFVPNFDESLEEPSVLPARLPNLLVNGSSGIAVGMATNIPPHNLNEIVDAIAKVIDDPDISIKDLMKIVKGPDFPTGGIICGREGIKEAFETGRGRLKLHAKAAIEQQKGNKEAIIITEIPYQVNKSKLIEDMANLVQDKKIEGISDIRDESDKEGMRIVIDLKRDQNAQVVLNQLYKRTQMETTFGVIMLALVDGRPNVLNLKQALELYIKHRQEIVK
ncbi:MAG: hypothetical protein KKH08_00770, partial [Candidatus Omnitrophica bacterium]|nr:hypothetical protein [Candidatus Omnitrophota bacterium]